MNGILKSRQSSYLLLYMNLLKLRSDEVLIASSSVQSAVHNKMTHTVMSSPPSFEKAHQCKCGLLHLLRLQLQQSTPLLASVYNSIHDSAPPSHELRVAYEYLYRVSHYRDAVVSIEDRVQACSALERWPPASRHNQVAKMTPEYHVTALHYMNEGKGGALR